MNPRRLYFAAAVLLALAAIAMPTEWYATIPRFGTVADLPFSGVSLLRFVFLFEAILLAAVAVRDTRFVAHPALGNQLLPPRQEISFDIGARWAAVCLLLITVLAIWLRLHRLDLDLWLDEISPLMDYKQLSAVQVIGSYLRSNNHLLNTLLEKAIVSTVGESELSVRAPAVVFGVLTVPLLYWFARLGLSRIASLTAALLLACSYHHIFFSQNARGYTGYLLFALASTGMLLRALRGDSFWRWTLYVACAVLGMASLLLTAFVIASHCLLAVALVWRAKREGQVVQPLVRRVAAVFLVVGLLSFQIYAAALPEAYVTLTSIYAEPATGFPVFSMDLLHEIIRGVTVGFGSTGIALLFLIAGALGYAALLKTAWPLAVSLALPPVLTVILLIVRGLTFSPRFFLLAVPLAMLSAAAALQFGGIWMTEHRRYSGVTARVFCAAAAVIVAAVSLRSLPYYYRTPKQPYRSTIHFLEQRGDTSKVIVVGTAELGMRYYLARAGVSDASSYVYTRSTPQFDSLVSSDLTSRTRVVTTFSRALGINYPGIDVKLKAEWQPDTTFSATVGDGAIVVWSRRARAGT